MLFLRERLIEPYNDGKILKRIQTLTLIRSSKMTKKHKPTDDAVEILHRRIIGDDLQKMAELEKIRAEDDVARKLYNLRVEAGLSQRALAKLIGTTASVICRLESADYEGHSLAMLNRIALALDKRVEIRFMPIRRRRRPKTAAK